MEKSAKLEKLKDLSLNPFLIPDPYDASMNVMQRWKHIASSAQAQAATPEQRQKVASNFYDKQIGPVYAAMSQKFHSPLPDKQNWMDNAYTSALKWDMDSAYESHWRSGLYEGFKGFENLARTGITILGGLLNADTAQAMAQASEGESINKKQAQIQQEGAFRTMQEDADALPFTHHTIQSLKRASSADAFWHDINPDTTWGEKARSFAAENLMQLPLYLATGGVTSSLVEDSAVPLTKLLSSSKAGMLASKLLLNGTEGAMYGYTMADDADKNREMISGGITQAILGSIFHVRGEKLKLSEAVTPERAAQLDDLALKAEAAKKGWTKADSVAMSREAEEAMKNSSLAGGRKYLTTVLDRAFKHIKDTEGMQGKQLRDTISALHESDAAKWKQPLIIAQWIRTLMPEGKKFSELSTEEKSFLRERLLERIKSSDTLVQAHGPEVDKRIEQVAQSPVGKKVVADVGPQAYALQNKAAAEASAQEIKKKPIDEALDIAEKRGEQVKINGDPGQLKTRTKYKGAGANRSVSYSVERQWLSHAKKEAKEAGFGLDLKKWLDGLSHEDFVQDAYDFFYPQSLKDIGMDHVESSNVKNIGKENPNFLAFMYNFRDRMPKVFADRLRDEFLDTEKVQQWIGTRTLDEPQLVRYAEGMKAHMDELLTTEKFKNANVKGEVGNVYRSTYESPDEPTEHQLELHEEVIEKERELIAGMFKGRPEGLKQAMTSYNLLAAARFDAFESGQQKVRMGLHDDIDKLLVKLSKGKLEKWEY